MAVETFYPDAAGVDGDADGGTTLGPFGSWNTIHDHAGSAATDSANYFSAYVYSHSEPGEFVLIRRAIIVIDVSDLPAGAIVDGVTLSLYGWIHGKPATWNTSYNVYASAPASNTEVVAGDYNSFYYAGADTPWCDTAIADGDLNTGDPGTSNDWVFNATGIAAVQAAADGDTVVKFGIREATYDAPDSAPPWVNLGEGYFYPWASEKGVGYKPKLVVTYHISEVVGRSHGYIIG